MSKLANEKSPYLRHAAATQKVDWYPWSEEVFAVAREQNKPIFLSTGAVWCHWCHVMAKESFEDQETAALMNELFINIKLDRDERPDIDRRYQQAVASMGGRGGWPLSVFLTPDKKAFFGGTYFPPRDTQGMPGFKNVLKTINEFYKTKSEEAESYAARIMEAIKPIAIPPGEIAQSLLLEAEQSMFALFDQEHGGFGRAPKFPMPGALEFLLRRSSQDPKSATGEAAKKMLIAMARGGFYDQLGNGFHRYSTDEAWIVPHFEKMADDNAGLLKNYIDGYALFKDEQFREIAQGIIAYTREVLSDPQGGFYASQDADVTPDDEGGYFTWTEEEFRSLLSEEEYPVLFLSFFDERGAMHHDPAKMVLSCAQTEEDVAAKLKIPVDEVRRIMQSGKEKLLKAREKRETPFIDKTLYASLNGMMIASFFHAYNVLGDEQLKNFAIKSLDRILRERIVQGRLLHVEGVPAVLDDYIYLIDALIMGYEATAKHPYLVQAEGLMDECLASFYDEREGGFFDTADEVLGARLKRIEDVPHPSPNGLAILLLLKLSLMTGKEAYNEVARKTLRLFSGLAQSLNIHAGAYFCALDAYFCMLKLTVEAASDSALAREARALAGNRQVTIVYGEDHGRVMPCKQNACLEPISDPVRLKEACSRL
jgi:hypothetical protein